MKHQMMFRSSCSGAARGFSQDGLLPQPNFADTDTATHFSWPFGELYYNDHDIKTLSWIYELAKARSS